MPHTQLDADMTEPSAEQPAQRLDRNTPALFTLEQRRQKVTLAHTPRYWLDRDPVKTHFMNALSVLIPAVEFVVIAILRRYESRIADPAIREDARRVVRQESSHAFVHALCNQKLTAAGYAAVPRFDRVLRAVLGLLCRLLPMRAELAIPSLFEVYTAALSRDIVTHRRQWFGDIGCSDPEATAIVLWHALEELEHQAVCGDVYRQFHRGRLLPGLLLVLLTPPTVLWLLVTHVYLLGKDGLLLQKGGLRQLLRFVLAADSPYRLLLRQSFRLFKPDADQWGGMPTEALKAELDSYM